MFETLDKILLAGLGALSMTRERAEKVFDEAVKRGQEVRADREKFVADLMDSAQKARANLEEIIRRQLRLALEEMDVPSREQAQRIEAKLDTLLARSPVPSGTVSP